MAERLGAGEWTYDVNVNWAKIPDEIVLGDCAAVVTLEAGPHYPSVTPSLPRGPRAKRSAALLRHSATLSSSLDA